MILYFCLVVNFSLLVYIICLRIVFYFCYAYVTHSNSKTTFFGFVYIIKSELGYKIGMTKSIHDRTKIFNVKLPIKWEFEKIYCFSRG